MIILNTVEVLPSIKIGTFPSNVFSVDHLGRVTLSGDARFRVPMGITAENLRAPTVKPATLVDYGIGVAWEFSDAVDDTVVGTMVAPSYIDSTVLPALHMVWSSPTADPGDNSKQARWQIEYLWRAYGEPMDAAAEVTSVANYTASTVAKGMVFASITLSNYSTGDSLLKFRIKRRADEAGDTINGDVVHLQGLAILPSYNQIGEWS
jgi:hypothetical protein